NPPPRPGRSLHRPRPRAPQPAQSPAIRLDPQSRRVLRSPQQRTGCAARPRPRCDQPAIRPDRGLQLSQPGNFPGPQRLLRLPLRAEQPTDLRRPLVRQLQGEEVGREGIPRLITMDVKRLSRALLALAVLALLPGCVSQEQHNADEGVTSYFM